MKKLLLISLLSFIYLFTIQAQAVYVDSNIGNDNNPGTEKSPVFSINKAAEIMGRKDNDIYIIKINPGIYVLNKHIEVCTKKTMTNKRIIVEASILPDDENWTPDKMPIIKTISKTGEIMVSDFFIKDNWITCFYVKESHVTFRGLKFLGYNYPTSIFYPISRFDKTKTDLSVEQCMFLGDLQSSVIQVSVIARGNSFNIDHCVFYNANNSAVFYADSTGSSMTNCIVYGANETAIWTVKLCKDFIYKNNIVSNCNYFWLRDNPADTTKYSIENCVIVNNQHFQGGGYMNPATFTWNEKKIVKDGSISIRMINSIWEPCPKDHLHIIPNTLGYDLGAGLFKIE